MVKIKKVVALMCILSLITSFFAINTATAADTVGTTPVTLTLNPTDDAYVRSGNYADTNYGTSTTLEVKSDSTGYARKAYIKFSFGSFSESSTTSAKLRLNVASAGSDSSRTIKVYGTSDESWTETGVTWNNAPAGITYIGSINVSNTAGLWYEVDVTSYINSQMSDKVVSFLLVNEGASSSNGIVSFNSREVADYQPQLVITPTQTTNPNTHSGTWAMQQLSTGTPTWSGTFQTVTGCAINSSYVFKAWYKGAGQKVILKVYDSSWGLITQSADTASTGTWTELSTPTVNTGDNTTFIVQFCDSGNTVGTSYIDDCFFGVDGGANKLRNADFEAGNTAWTIGRPFSIVQPPNQIDYPASAAIKKTETPVNLDGIVETDPDGTPSGDWAGAGLVNIAGTVDANGNSHSAKVYMKYDYDNLYIGAKIKDPTPMINNNTGTNIWNGDCLELFVGTEDIDYVLYPDKKGQMLPSDVQIVFSGGINNGYQYYKCVNGVFTTPLIYMDVKMDADGKGYTIEAAIPLNTLDIKNPWEGQQMIMNAVLNDGGSSGRGQWGWTANGESNKKSRGLWGLATFETGSAPSDEVSVNVSVSEDTNLITVSGQTFNVNEKEVTLLVKDPNGNIANISQSPSDAKGNYTFTFPINNDIFGSGLYTVSVGGDGVNRIKTAAFTYDATKQGYYPIVSNSEIDPVAASYDKNPDKQADIAVSMILKGNTLKGIKHSGVEVADGSDYTVGGNIVIIKKEYLSSLPLGPEKLDFEFSAGDPSALMVNVSDTTPSNDAELSNIQIKNGFLAPDFDSNKNIYVAFVDQKAGNFSIIPTASSDKYKSITINGTSVVSAVPYTVEMKKKIDVFKIEVTAEDGKTTETYYIIAVRSNVKKVDKLISDKLEKYLKKYVDRIDEISNNSNVIYDEITKLVR